MSAELVMPTSTDLQKYADVKPVVRTDPIPLDWYFPKLDPGRRPLGARVIVQLRRTKKTSKGGIILQHETKVTEKWNDQVAMVVALGPIAFRNRETMAEWPEGIWTSPGKFVSVPRWGGDRWEKKVEGEEEEVTFVTFNDHELISEITEDPRNVNAYILE